MPVRHFKHGFAKGERPLIGVPLATARAYPAIAAVRLEDKCVAMNTVEDKTTVIISITV
jgi:hypothetical protein